MTNILLQYMTERFNTTTLKEPVAIESKPFITISREYGCPAKEVAAGLEKKLNLNIQKGSSSTKWRVISKEIMDKTAQELHVEPSRISKIFNEEKRSAIDEILNSFSEKYYKSDRKIINTLSIIIKDFAAKGNIIIIGRNGVGLTSELLNGLHVRLVVPIEWRVKRLMDKCYFKTLEEARIHAEEIDYHRNIFMKSKTLKDPMFDVYYNTQRFNSEEISESIINLLSFRNSNKS